MIQVTYVFLLLIMLSCLFISGNRIKRNFSVLKAFPIGIIAYSLNEGLRFGRGIDFNLYCPSYYETIYNNYTDFEFLYTAIIKLFGLFDIPYQGFIFFQSLFLVLCFFVFILRFRQIADYALFLLPIFTLAATENLIRWFFAYSFILLGLYVLMGKSKNKIYWYVLFSFLALQCHIWMLPVCVGYFVINLMNKPLMKPLYSIALFLLITFVFQTDYLLSMSKMFDFFASSAKYSNYVDNIDYWLLGGARQEASTYLNISTYLLLLVIVYYGYKIIDINDKKYVFVYNLFLIGFITKPIARASELINRFNVLFYMFQFIIAAYIIYTYVKQNGKFLPKAINRIFVSIVLFYTVINFICSPLKESQYHFLYVWNKKNKSECFSNIEIKNYWLNDNEKK